MRALLEIEYCGISGTTNLHSIGRKPHFFEYCQNARLHFSSYDQIVINITELLRMGADMLEKSQDRVTEQRNESGREIDPQAISDALFVLGATGISIVRELIDSLPERPRLRSNSDSSIFSTEEVEKVLSQIVARMGLVEESELAALRKRLMDLESKLGN